MRRPRTLIALALFGVVAAVAVWLWDPVRADVMAAQPDDLVLGDPNAPVRIVAYVAPSCLACGAFHRDLVPRLKAEWLDSRRAVLVYRNAPTSDTDLVVSKFLRCIAPTSRPDQSLAWLEVAFQTQATWLAASDPVQGLQRAGRELGRSNFDRLCLDHPVVEESVLRARDAAADAGVRSLPAIFVQGRKVAPADLDRTLAKVANAQR